MPDVMLDEVLEYGLREKRSPEDIAAAVRSWQADVTAEGKSYLKDNPAGYWEGTRAVDEEVNAALSGLAAAAWDREAAKDFPDAGWRDQLRTVFQVSGGDADRMLAPPDWKETARRAAAAAADPAFRPVGRQMGTIAQGSSTLAVYEIRPREDGGGYEAYVQPRPDDKGQPGTPVILPIDGTRETLAKAAAEELAATKKEYSEAYQAHTAFPFALPAGLGDAIGLGDPLPRLERRMENQRQRVAVLKTGSLDQVLHTELDQRLRRHEAFLQQLPQNRIQQFTSRVGAGWARSAAQGVAAVSGVGAESLQEGHEAVDIQTPGMLRSRFEKGDDAPVSDMISQGIESALNFIGPAVLAKGAGTTLGAAGRTAAARAVAAAAAPAAWGTMYGSAFGANLAGGLQEAEALQQTDPERAEHIRRLAYWSSAANAGIELATERIFADEARLMSGQRMPWRSIATIPAHEAIEEYIGAVGQNVLAPLTGRESQDPLENAEAGFWGGFPFAAGHAALRVKPARSAAPTAPPPPDAGPDASLFPGGQPSGPDAPASVPPVGTDPAGPAMAQPPGFEATPPEGVADPAAEPLVGAPPPAGTADPAASSGSGEMNIPPPLTPATEQDPTGTVPETPETLAEQRRRVVSGQRPAMLFPGLTPDRVPREFLPGQHEDLILTDTPAGTFLHPFEISSAEILQAVESGSTGHLLGMGTAAKPPDATAAVVQRTADGTEVTAAAVNPETIAPVTQALRAAASPGDTFSLETPQDVVTSRLTGAPPAPPPVPHPGPDPSPTPQSYVSARGPRIRAAYDRLNVDGSVPVARLVEESGLSIEDIQQWVDQYRMATVEGGNIRLRDGAGQGPAISGAPEQAATPESVEGEPINRRWTAFSAESGTVGIPRAEMPQIQSEHRGALVNFLNARGVAHGLQTVRPDSLKPTQAEYSPAKVDKARTFTGKPRAILVSADNHVVDGHHQWVAALDNPDRPIPVMRLHAPIRDLIPMVNDFPSATQSGGGAAVQSQPQPQERSEESAPPESPGTVEDWANRTIAASRGRLYSGVPDPALLAAYAVKGSLLLGRGVRDFTAWSAEMVREFSEAVRPYLERVWAQVTGREEPALTDSPAPAVPDDFTLPVNLFGQRVQSDPRLRESFRADFVPGEYSPYTEEDLLTRMRQWIGREGGLEGGLRLGLSLDSGLLDYERSALLQMVALGADKRARRMENTGDKAATARAEEMMDNALEALEALATRAGQALRSFAIWSRLSSRGIVRHIQRQTAQQRTRHVSTTLPVTPEGAMRETDKAVEEATAEAAAEREARTPDVTQNWINRLATSQSDTLSWRRPKPLSELEKLIRAHMREVNPDFVAQAQALGVPEAKAGLLDTLVLEEHRRAEAIVRAKAEELRMREAPQSVKPWIDRLATSQSDTLSWRQPKTLSELERLVRAHLREANPDFVAQAHALGVPEAEAGLLDNLILEEHRRTAAIGEAKAEERRQQEAPNTLRRWMDRLATSQSDTPSWRETPRALSQMEQLIRGHLKEVNPDFAAQAQALGVPAHEAAALDRMVMEEHRRTEAAARALEEERRRREAPNTAARWLQRLAASQSDTLAWGTPRTLGQMEQLIRAHMKAVNPDFAAQAQALGVPAHEAAALDRAVLEEHRRGAAIAQEKAAQKLIDRLTLPKAARKVKESIPPLVKALLDAKAAKALTRAAFLDAYASAFNMPRFTPEFAAEIRRMAQQVEAMPKGGWMQNRAKTQLMARLARWEGVPVSSVATAFWYSNILSGPDTQAVNVKGNAEHLFLKALAAGLASHHRHWIPFIKGMMMGAQEGGKQAWAHFWHADPIMKGESKWQGANTLEMVWESDPQTFLGKLFKWGPANFGRFVFRGLTAADGMFFTTAKEGRKWLETSRALERGQDVKAALGYDTRTWMAAQDQAAMELRDAGVPQPTTRMIDRRAYEITEARQDPERLAAAQRWAQKITFNHEPNGTLGLVAGALNSTLSGMERKLTIAPDSGLAVRTLAAVTDPLRFTLRGVIPFVNIVTNMASSALDYTPVGYVRAALGRHITNHNGPLWTDMERRETAIGATIAMLTFATLAAVALAYMDLDDATIPFWIYDAGPEDKNQRAQMPRGWKPFSVKIGDYYIPFSESVVGVPLAAVAGVLNRERRRRRQAMNAGKPPPSSDMFNRDEAWERAGAVLASSSKSLMKTGVLSSIDKLFSAMEGKSKPDQMLFRTVTGFVPAQGAMRAVAKMMDPTTVDTSTFKGTLLSVLPVLRSKGQPMLNVFGENVREPGDDFMARLASRFVTAQDKSDPDAYWLASQGLRIPGVNDEIQLEEYTVDSRREAASALRVLRITGLERDRAIRAMNLKTIREGVMTPEQKTAFIRSSGPLIRNAVRQLRRELETRSFKPENREEIQNRLSGKVTAARKVARMQLIK